MILLTFPTCKRKKTFALSWRLLKFYTKNVNNDPPAAPLHDQNENDTPDAIHELEAEI